MKFLNDTKITFSRAKLHLSGVGYVLGVYFGKYHLSLFSTVSFHGSSQSICFAEDVFSLFRLHEHVMSDDFGSAFCKYGGLCMLGRGKVGAWRMICAMKG